MDCAEARPELLAHRRGRLAPALAEAVGAHLETCEACRRAEAAEGELDALLAAELPRCPAPGSLRRRLEELVVETSGASGADASTPRAARARAWLRRELRWQQLAVPALAAGLAAAVAVVAVERRPGRAEPTLAAVASEAVSDHLRVLIATQPLELMSSATHQVKPWFEGRLDFAPTVPLPAVPDLRLEGAAVGYFLDHKAAVVAYRLRRHAVTLLAFRAEGLPWPVRWRPGTAPAVQGTSSRGFRVALWREGELGYALVSDVEAAELRELAGRFAGGGG